MRFPPKSQAVVLKSVRWAEILGIPGARQLEAQVSKLWQDREWLHGS